MAKDEIILSVSGLSVEFGEHTILDNLSFNVARDSTLAVIGANGAGKTVLFKSLLGLIPFKGKIAWASDARIGYVPQKMAFDRDLPLTVMEFLKLKEDSREKINIAIAKVGFREKAEHRHHDTRVLNERIGNLSGGELQRILMAYALLGDPNVLLLDEPTAGVDIKGEETFYSLFKKLKAEKDLTILFISHDSGIVQEYADNVLSLKHEH